MFEQNFEHEDRYIQQGRRPNSSYYDRRSSSRGYQPEDDRFEGDRFRYRGQDSYRNQDSDRRYTRPDYDSDLDIERPGQARFGSRGGSYGSSFGSNDYSREFDNETSAWRRPGRSPQGHDRNDFGYRSDSNRFDSNRYDQGRFDSNRYDQGRFDQNRDWQSSNIGHADWNTRSDWNRSGSYDQSGNRGSFDQQQQHPNEQKNRWPKSYKRNDDRLKDDIHEELIRHGRIDASDIEVQVKEGEVILTGAVTSRQDKRIAEELAEKVLGVHDVQNQLRVKQQQNSSQGHDQQRSGSSPSLPGSNRVSSVGQQDQSSKAANSSSK